MLGLPSPPSTPQPALLPAESLKDLVASCSRGAKAEAPMEVVKAEVMEMLTPPPSDVGSPSHSSPLSLSGGSSNSSSDSEPDSPLCDHGKVWGSWGGGVCPPTPSGAVDPLHHPGNAESKARQMPARGEEPRALVLLPEAAPHPIWGWREGCGAFWGALSCCTHTCAMCSVPQNVLGALYPVPVPMPISHACTPSLHPVPGGSRQLCPRR